MISSTLFRLLLLLLFSYFVQSSASAQLNSVDSPTVSGTVQSSNGSPVSGADVWLMAGEWGKPIELARATSNSDGTFSFDIRKHEEQLNRFSAYACVLCKHPEHGLGWFGALIPERRKGISLKLEPCDALEGQVTDASGDPISDVTIYPKTFHSGTVAKSSNAYAQIPRSFSPAWETKTDEQGKFSIGGLPSAGVAFLKVEHSTIEDLTIQSNLGHSVAVKLDAAFACSGKIVPPASFDHSTLDQNNIGTVKLSCYSARNQDGSVAADPNHVSMRYVSQFSTPIKQDFSFQFDGVTAGSYRVAIELDDSVRLAAPYQIPNWNVGKETEPLIAKAVSLFRVSGKVVSGSTGDAVDGATVSFGLRVDGYPRYFGQAVTDDQGSYSKNVPAGILSVNVRAAPKGFVPLPNTYDDDLEDPPTKRVEVVADATIADFKLDSACDIMIKVLDEKGAPAVGAIVKAVTVAGYPDGDFRKPVQKTDANGHYVIRQIAVNDTLPIWVRTPTAISQPLVVVPDELDGPVEMKLSTQGVRFRVQVFDDDDGPVAGVQVSLGTSFRYQSKWGSNMGISGSAGSGETDENGEYFTGPLWPDKKYVLTASAEGFWKAETPRMGGDAGEVIDAGKLVIKRARKLNIGGVVVDDNGTPIVGANVFCAGGKYGQAVATTDSKGHFMLNEVAVDLKYVFAQHPKFRFGGAQVSYSSETEIKLRSVNSPPETIRALKSLNVNQQHEAAHEVLLQAWDLPMNARRSSRIQMLCSLDRIDPELAMELSGANGIRFRDRFIRLARAQQLNIRDTKNVIPLLITTGERSAFEVARRNCSRLSHSGDSEDEVAAVEYLKFAEEMAGDTISRKIELAGLCSQLGRMDKARTLVNKIFKEIEDRKIPEDKYPLAELASALAPLDFEKALTLTNKLKAGATRTYAQADVALAILKQDPEKSLAMIAELEGDANAKNIRDKTRFRAALRLVDQSPEMAIALCYQCEDAGNRSQALGRLAVRVTEFDRARSWQMIEDAISIFKRANVHHGWSYSGGDGPFAAAVAYQAKLVEYPDMKSIVWHVLAACRGSSREGQEQFRTTICTARMLALTDKFAARKLLGLVAKQEDQIPRETYDLSLYDQFLQAWTLVEFGRGAALIKKDLERIKETGVEENFRYGHGGVFRLLVAPSDEQFHVLFQQTGLWQLEEDGTRRPW